MDIFDPIPAGILCQQVRKGLWIDSDTIVFYHEDNGVLLCAAVIRRIPAVRTLVQAMDNGVFHQRL